MDKIPQAGYGKEYWAHYAGTRNGYTKGWGVHAELIQMITDTFPIPKGGVVVDIGGCFGYQAAILARATGAIVHVVDYSAYAVANHDPTIPRDRMHLVDIGVDQLPFGTDALDFAYSVETFEHIYEPEVDHAIQELHRVLKPGAWFYGSISCVERGGTPEQDPTHICWHQYQWWQDTFQEYGFCYAQAKVDLLNRYTIPQKMDPRDKVQLNPIVNRYGWAVFAFQNTE